MSIIPSKRITESKWFIGLQIFFMILWGTQIARTHSYYINYILIFFAALFCAVKNIKDGNCLFKKIEGRFNAFVVYAASILFTLMTALANYNIWALGHISQDFESTLRIPYNTFLIIVFFFGGFCIFQNIFLFIYKNTGKLFLKERDKAPETRKIFFISLALLVVTRLLVLLLCQYPGELTVDSLNQMKQIMTNDYSNHHPVYHTMVIKFFITIGSRLFHNMNAAVCLYSVFQVIFIGACFSFAVATMEQMKAPRWAIILTMIFYVAMPYHLVYAFTLWKDIMFGGFVLVLITTLFRYMNGVGNKKLNIILLALSSLGTCLFRSNGFFVFVLLTFIVAITIKLKDKMLIILMGTMIILSFTMKHIALSAFDIEQADTIESLAIPTQQIAKVVYENGDMDEHELELITQLAKPEKIRQRYNTGLVDPIKNLVRYYGNQDLIKEQKADYIKLYISLGLKNPFIYARAWIDQTVGYWNSGYDYWRWNINDTPDNDMSIFKQCWFPQLNTLFKEYLWLSTNIVIMRPFLSIGVFVWLDMVLLMIALLKKDRHGAIATLPVLLIVLSLLIATPVYSEFRYIYAAFCSLPMTAMIALRPKKEEKNNG